MDEDETDIGACEKASTPSRPTLRKLDCATTILAHQTRRGVDEDCHNTPAELKTQMRR